VEDEVLPIPELVLLRVMSNLFREVPVVVVVESTTL
jgi:hypothetical protein